MPNHDLAAHQEREEDARRIAYLEQKQDEEMSKLLHLFNAQVARIVDLEAQLQAVKERERVLVEALGKAAVPLEVLGGQIVASPYTEIAFGLQELIVNEVIPAVRSAIRAALSGVKP